MGLLSMIAELGVNINPFVTGLGRAKAEADKFAETAEKKFMGLGTGIRGKLTGALLGFISVEAIKGVTEYAGEVKGLQARLNTTAEDAQALKFAAGGSIDEVASAFKKIRVAQASAETKEMSAAWKSLGFNIGEVQQKRADQIFFEIAAKVKAGSLSNHEYAAMLKIMGKNADELIPKLKNMAENVELFKKSGATLTEADLQRLLVTKRLDKAGEILKSYGRQSLADLLTPGFGGVFRGVEAANAKAKIEADLKSAEAREREQVAAEGTAERVKQEMKDMEEILRIEERTRSVRFNTLRDDQKRAAFRKELKELQQEAIEGFTSPEAKAQNTLAQAEAREKLFQLNKHSLSRISADSLAASGTFIGGASASVSPMVDIARQQLQAQQQIVRNTDPTQNVNTF